MTNDIKKVEDRFVNSLGSGEGAARSLLEMIEAVSVSRDATVLSRAIIRAESKGDTSAASLVRFVVGEVWKGAKLTRSKDKKSISIKIKGVQACEDTIGRLRDGVDRKLSLRHSTFRKVVKGDTGDNKKDFDANAWANREVKKHTRAEIDAMIAALQARRGEAKA